MLAAIGSLAVLGLTLGGLLAIAGRYLKVEGNPLRDEIEACLPGSQCGQCGFPGCGPAADAVAAGKAPVTLCPPGGRAVAGILAEKIGVVLDLAALEESEPVIAFVNEDQCIGCTRCLRECATDALVGGPKSMHTVISDICTGCGKCAVVCPTDCIEMRPIEVTIQTWHWPKPDARPLAA